MAWPHLVQAVEDDVEAELELDWSSHQPSVEWGSSWCYLDEHGHEVRDLIGYGPERGVGLRGARPGAQSYRRRAPA